MISLSIVEMLFALILTFNSLAPGKFEWNFGYVIFKWILVIDGWGICCEIALIWMLLDFTDDQSTLVQVMAWCRQTTSHYLSQCWPRSLSPYGVTRPQWVNDPIILQFCTGHDIPVFVACATLWHDQNIIFCIRAPCFSTRNGLWAHKLWNGSHHLKINCSYFNDQIRSQFCTHHNSLNTNPRDHNLVWKPSPICLSYL